MSGPQQQRQLPPLTIAVKAACQRVIDTIAAESEDIHAASHQLNGAIGFIHERLLKAQEDSVKDLEALVVKAREARQRQAAMERLAAAQQVDPGPAKLELVGLPE